MELNEDIIRIKSLMGLIYENEELGDIDSSVNFTEIRHGEWPHGSVYINGISDTDKDMLISIKENDPTTKIKFVSLINPSNNIEVEIGKLYITKNKNFYFLKTDYPNFIKSQIVKTLFSDDLKKMNSGFPKFLTELLFEQFKNNLGYNKYIGSPATCESNVGLIVDVDDPSDPLYNTNIDGQIWSILNFFDTNPKVIDQLLNWYYDIAS